MNRTVAAPLALLALFGCGGGPGTGDEDPPPCALSVHATQGDSADLTIERYRFIGASPDGTRVAVLYSHFGPSSAAPFASVFGWQAGVRTALFRHGRFIMTGGETELQECERLAIADSAADMLASGIVQGANLPVALPWCTAGDTACLGTGLQEWAWSTFAETCPGGAGVVQWQLCRTGDAACVTGTLDPGVDCGFTAGSTLSASLLDAFRAGTVVWVAVRKRAEPLSGLLFNATFVSGSSVANPPAP